MKMQTIPGSDQVSPSFVCYSNHEFSEESEANNFREKLKIMVSSERISFQESDDFPAAVAEANEDNEARNEKEEDLNDGFSFSCIGVLKSPISADDAFQNGRIKPIFPFFGQNVNGDADDDDDEDSVNCLSLGPPVNKIFIETNEAPSPSSSSSQPESNIVDEEAAGPYCLLSKKSYEATPEVCKKSNSTGFSKFWRFRDLLNRSNSDGRDAFVYLNNPAAEKKEVKLVEKIHRKMPLRKKNVAVTGAGDVAVKTKKGVKNKATSFSAHEKYMKERASSEGDRRRSYLPYRPELVGFFTNVNGGLSRNVHPF